MSRAGIIAWVMVYLGLGYLIGLQTGWGQGLRPPAPMVKAIQPAPVEYPIQREFALPPLGQAFAETTARPAFISVRRPPPPPEPPKPTMRKGQFILLGVLLTEDKNIALLREIASGKVIRVEQGREINGILLSSMLPERVVLTQYDDSEELTLKINPLPNATANTKPEIEKARVNKPRF